MSRVNSMKVFGKKISQQRISFDIGKARIEYCIDKIRSGYKITGTIQGKLGRIEVLRCKAPKTFLMNNWQSWGPTQKISSDAKLGELGKIAQDNRLHVFSPIPETILQHLVSDYFVCWENMLLGFLSSRIAHPFFVVEGGDLVGYLEYFDTTFNKAIPLEPLVVLKGEPAESLLERYGGMIQAENKIIINPWNPIGWCSWYQYFGKLEWGDIIKNLDIAKREKGFPFDVFQIDDGYEQDIGDWMVTKQGYPPVRELVHAIESRGFIAGIWTAPTSVAETSRLFAEKPGWMVSERKAPKFCYKAWSKKIYALDTTNPDAKNWLFETFQSLKKTGFDYFKIDFMFSAAMPGTRKKNFTPIQAYREGLRVIKKAVGESFILGCGAPLLPSAGLVDGMRVGEDTAPYWKTKPSPFQGPNAYFALKNAILRQFMHKKLWLNDPDCLLLRSKDIKLTENERELYALVAGALDNMLIDSDDLSLVDEAGKRLFAKAIALRGGKVKIQGLLNDDFYLIESKGSASGDFILAANLSDEAKLYKGNSIPARSVELIAS
jgi:alpha-galactosidase